MGLFPGERLRAGASHTRFLLASTSRDSQFSLNRMLAAPAPPALYGFRESGQNSRLMRQPSTSFRRRSACRIPAPAWML